jgi:molybdenum cofactor cytidylyltransferase
MSKLPVGILLAAGKSLRFGSNKLLHPVMDNTPIDFTPMLMVSAQKLASVLPGSIVVIHQNLFGYVEQLEQMGLRVVINEQAEKGMGSSIACGVRASQDATGWLITLADMPYTKTETLSLLASKLKEGANIIAPVYDQQRGHPVGFNRCFKNELVALDEDVGARYLITKYQKQLELLPIDDDGVLRDIDCLDDVSKRGIAI